MHKSSVNLYHFLFLFLFHIVLYFEKRILGKRNTCAQLKTYWDNANLKGNGSCNPITIINRCSSTFKCSLYFLHVRGRDDGVHQIKTQVVREQQILIIYVPLHMGDPFLSRPSLFIYHNQWQQQYHNQIRQPSSQGPLFAPMPH